MPTAQSPMSLHLAATNLALRVQRSSTRKYSNASNDITRDAFFVLSHDAICVHRAIGDLVKAGWSSPATALARTLFDIWISAGAIVFSKKPALAAFKYFYSGHNSLSRDVAYPAAARAATRKQIRDRIKALPPPDQDDAIDAMKDKVRAYWFNPEWKSPSDVIPLLGPKELDLPWRYRLLSAAAHGSFFGLRVYRERYEEHDVNPRLPPGKTAYSVAVISAGFLLELTALRDQHEQLEAAQDCEKLRHLLNATAARL